MRFMIIRKADKETEAGVLPSEELLVAMGKYVEEMVQAGVMISGDGLKPSSEGARVKFSGGKPTVIDGPFTETKELVAGFSILEVKSKEEAIEWVKRWPAIDAGGEVEIEIRPFWELEDFGSSEGVEYHAQLKEQMAKQ
jgi:PhnB protein